MGARPIAALVTAATLAYGHFRWGRAKAAASGDAAVDPFQTTT